MIIKRNELIRYLNESIDFDYSYDQEEIKEAYLRKIISAKGKIKFININERIIVNLKLNAALIVPCAITNEDLEYNIDLNEDLVIGSDEDSDYYFEKEFELKDLIYHSIIKEIPIKLVKNKKIVYPNGDGWQILTEKEYQNSKKDQSDPRWDKLKELLKNKED